MHDIFISIWSAAVVSSFLLCTLLYNYTMQHTMLSGILYAPVTVLCLPFAAAWLVPYGSCYCSVSVLCGCMIGSLWLLLLLSVNSLWLHDWFLMAPVTTLCLSFVAAWLFPYGSCYCSVSVLCGCMIGSLWLLLLLCVCPLWLHDWFLMAPVTALCLSFVAARLVPYGSCYCSVSVLCGCTIGSLWLLLLLCVCPLWLHDWFLMAPVTALCLSFVAAWLVPYGSCYCSVSVLSGCMIGSLWLLLLLCVCPLWLHAWFLLLLCICPLWLHDWFLMAPVTALCLSFVAAWLVPMAPFTALCLSFVAARLVPYGSCYCYVSALCGCMIGSLWLL